MGRERNLRLVAGARRGCPRVRAEQPDRRREVRASRRRIVDGERLPTRRWQSQKRRAGLHAAPASLVGITPEHLLMRDRVCVSHRRSCARRRTMFACLPRASLGSPTVPALQVTASGSTPRPE